ncbi:MAG: hypothetical protein JW984_10090 [Deltaproteobacteria bacterium]|uniref:Uncharacterized protein n=1 Tax=Candidatus Zymogenus saltonus TaxID=2844893 RepID=A0A9D8KFD0_9DELT|nr:hypothetical protein [Candidatus Zymogenus saltonus]
MNYMKLIKGDKRRISILAVSALFVLLLTTNAFPKSPLETGNQIIAERADELIKGGGKAETYAYGAIADNDNNRNMFRIPALISELTGLDFVPLAIIEHIGSDIVLYATVAGLPDDLRGKEDAVKILARRQLKHFERTYYDSYFKELKGEDHLTFSNAAAKEVSEAFTAEYGDLTASDPESLGRKYPTAKEASELTGIDISALSRIRAFGGLESLLKFLSLLPEDLPGRDKAIKVVAKEKRKAGF